MKPVYGNHLGWVVNTQADPENRQRVQVFVPHLSNTVYTEWNEKLQDLSFKNINELNRNTLIYLQNSLPWAECAMPIWGDGTSMKLNGPAGTLRVNGQATFDSSKGTTRYSANNGDNVLASSSGGQGTSGTILGSNFDLSYETRTTLGGSSYGNRQVSLDYNYGSTSTGVGVVVPVNATAQELSVARDYASSVQQWYAAQGINKTLINEDGLIYRTWEGYTVNRFHTEPFAIQDEAAANAVKNNTAVKINGNTVTYASILANTFGTLPGVTFIAPHEDTDGGAPGLWGLPNEREFARSYILPELKKLQSDSTADPDDAQNPDDVLPPVDTIAEDEKRYMGLDTDEAANGETAKGVTPSNNSVSVGSGNATRFSDSGGVFGTFDSSLPNIGIFPWTLEQLAAERPDLVRTHNDPNFSQYSKYTLAAPLYATFTYNGKTYGAVVNDVGSAYNQTTVEGQNRLFDIAENGSLVSLLGINSGENLKGVGNFSIDGLYTDQSLGEIGGASGGTTAGGTPADGTPADGTTADGTTEEETSDQALVNRIGNQGSKPDTTIGGQGSPNGMFSVPAFGAKVWVFYYDGDVQRPVYFASAIEPPSGRIS